MVTSLHADPRAGRVVAVFGPVIDVAFDTGALPSLLETMDVEWDRPEHLVAEVQSHLDVTTVRAVTLQPTAGLQRGTPVRATERFLAMPVGDPVLGRLPQRRKPSGWRRSG